MGFPPHHRVPPKEPKKPRTPPVRGFFFIKMEVLETKSPELAARGFFLRR